MAFSKAVEEELVASTISVHRGGLATALAKSAIAGQVGMDIELEKVPSDYIRDDFTLYSESQGRLVVTVNPDNRERFERAMGQNMFAVVGKIRGDNQFRITQKGKPVIDTTVDKISESYKSTFKDY